VVLYELGIIGAKIFGRPPRKTSSDLSEGEAEGFEPKV